jgi:predicted RND superfamily exporter protein
MTETFDNTSGRSSAIHDIIGPVVIALIVAAFGGWLNLTIIDMTSVSRFGCVVSDGLRNARSNIQNCSTLFRGSRD